MEEGHFDPTEFYGASNILRQVEMVDSIEDFNQAIPDEAEGYSPEEFRYEFLDGRDADFISYHDALAREDNDLILNAAAVRDGDRNVVYVTELDYELGEALPLVDGIVDRVIQPLEALYNRVERTGKSTVDASEFSDEELATRTGTTLPDLFKSHLVETAAIAGGAGILTYALTQDPKLATDTAIWTGTGKFAIDTFVREPYIKGKVEAAQEELDSRKADYIQQHLEDQSIEFVPVENESFGEINLLLDGKRETETTLQRAQIHGSSPV